MVVAPTLVVVPGAAVEVTWLVAVALGVPLGVCEGISE